MATRPDDLLNPRSTAFWKALLGVASLAVCIGLAALILKL
tara:strand:- start:898 stop:1017 length:120 start_codon:yes stop_codon:yes gene_type:complete